MKQSHDSLIGEFLFRAKDGNRAIVLLYRDKSTFTLRRMMQSGVTEERNNVDVYRGDISGYASEATLKWNDLEREGLEWKPKVKE